VDKPEDPRYSIGKISVPFVEKTGEYPLIGKLNPGVLSFNGKV
jgi:hypothetical protein